MSSIPPVSLPVVPIDHVQINSLKPDILFRFMNVRTPLKETPAHGLRYFIPNIYDSVVDEELTTIQADIETLYPQLIIHRGSTTELIDQQSDVEDYKVTDEFIPTPEDYAARFPELTTLISWLDAYSSNITGSEISTKFESVFTTSISAYTSALEFRKLQCILWDNLLANLYATDSSFLITLACKYLGMLHLLKVVDKEPVDGGGGGGGIGSGVPSELGNEISLAYVYRAKTLVPKWIYELFIASGEDPDQDVGDVTPVDDVDTTLQTKFEHLTLGITEIRKLIKKRTETVGRQLKSLQQDFEVDTRDVNEQNRHENLELYYSFSDAVKALDNPYEIVTGVSYGFSTSTTNLLIGYYPSWTALDLNNVLELFQEEINVTAGKLGSREKEFCVRIGDAIISQKELCADMTDRDPCAVLERKNFSSRGSFTNSALIGDLLLTEQQLIKYDVGEIAHVEAVMQGLDKERTHRRLDRTENTITTFHESTNETERESQTTERFSMEKETSNVIEQQFQINAGINTSAKYGLVNITSSLDASYGSSQSQSQQTATNLSRDVTNRALNRVKEIVRETQTITVINEIEETSVHKLQNTTSDNFNGVYRWLDKFYLNKVKNYGKRLMFEFSIPEPANFYIFRKMVTPKNGATVEKPTSPAELTGPDGFKLSSPAVLTDSNFAFWLAQYEVPNADAPPAEYIQFSRAFKNAYATTNSDVYDSFAADIPILDNYEAIQATIATKAAYWASIHSITPPYFEGQIGTTGFTLTPAPVNILLNNIRSTLALSTQSHAMNFEVNIVIKVHRTAESYNNWKLSTYAKIIDAYKQKQKAYDEWLNAQYADSTFGFTANTNNPGINREIEREELKKRTIELFTGQRYESFDAATNGIQNVSGYPEILFKEAITEGNLVKFFEQAFEWEHMTYIFYPYFWGRKSHWMNLKNIEDAGDPMFTKFLQAGYARVMVPARPEFENYLLMFNILSSAISSFGCAWNFTPAMFGALNISNEFLPGVDDTIYKSITMELLLAQGRNDDNAPVIGVHVQKVPTNLVYVVPNSVAPGDPLPGIPDNSADPDIALFI
ncbi:MAG: hypothetical protein ABIQ40_13445 [Bacteroidia bacterium]